MLRAVAWTFVVCLVLATGIARAGDREEAEKRFTAGANLAENGNCLAAIHEFEESIALVPTQNAFYNLGICYQDDLNQPVEAAYTFERLFKELGPDRIATQKRRDINSRLNKLWQLVGRLTINVEPEGTSIHVDGRVIGTSPLADPVILESGKHIMNLSLAGYQTYEVEIDISPGVKANLLHIVLSRAEEAKAPQEKKTAQTPPVETRTKETPGPETPKPEPVIAKAAPTLVSPQPVKEVTAKRGRGMLVGGIITGLAGAAGIVVGGYFTKQGADDKKALQLASQGSQETFDKLYTETLPRDQTMTFVGYALGGTLLATGAALILADWLINRKHERNGQPTQPLSRHMDGNIGVSF